MRKFLFGLVVGLAVLANIAATGTSEANGIAIATIFGLILPFLLKHVPAVGKYMWAITIGAAFVTAVGAELLSGELDIANLQGASVPVLLATFMSVYGLSQALFSLLKQSPTTAPAVTEPVPAPVVVPAPAPAPAVDPTVAPPVAPAA
jgi:hypothetical protein